MQSVNIFVELYVEVLAFTDNIVIRFVSLKHHCFCIIVTFLEDSSMIIMYNIHPLDMVLLCLIFDKNQPNFRPINCMHSHNSLNLQI